MSEATVTQEAKHKKCVRCGQGINQENPLFRTFLVGPICMSCGGGHGEDEGPEAGEGGEAGEAGEGGESAEASEGVEPKRMFSVVQVDRGQYRIEARENDRSWLVGTPGSRQYCFWNRAQAERVALEMQSAANLVED